jgi:Adaptin N terminal region
LLFLLCIGYYFFSFFFLGINVGYAIVYECVRTVTTIYPNTALLDAAAASIGRFISSENHNLKYLGVTGLAAIVRDHPRYATEHQLAVIDCLEDPDDTLKRKTLDLLYRMINPVNVTVIVDKLMHHLKIAVDTFLRTDLVERITQAAERFAPSNAWYIETMLAVFELGGDLIKPEVAQNLLRLLAEGSGESDEADMALRRDAVEGNIAFLDKPALPAILLQVIFWTLGEYGYLSTSTPLPAIVEKLCSLTQRAGIDVVTRGYGLASLVKLTAQIGVIVPTASALARKLSSSPHVDLAQRCHELNALSARPALMKVVLPVDASNEDIELDENMGFLGNFVAAAEAAGARPYAPPVNAEAEAAAAAAAAASNALKFDAYARPDPNASVAASVLDEQSFGGATQNVAADFAAPTPFGGIRAGGGGWGKSGFVTASGTTLAQNAQEKAAQAAAAATLGSTATMAPAVEPVTVAAFTAPVEAKPVFQGLTGFSAPAPAPRELTEREKLAASLFGGVGSASTTTSSRSGASASRAPAPAPVAAAPAPAPVAAPIRAAAPVPAPAPAPSASVDLLDLFGSAPAPAPAPRPAVADIFGGGGVSIATATGAAPCNLVATAIPPPGLLESVNANNTVPKEPATGSSILADDGSLAIGLTKFCAADSLLLVLYIASASAIPAGSVLSIAGLPFVSLLDARAAPALAAAPTPIAGNGLNITLGAIAPGIPTAVLIRSVLIAPPPAGTPCSPLRLTLSAVGRAAMSASLYITNTDVLRPLPMDTAAFGSLWTQPAMRGEQAMTLPVGQNTPRTLDTFMTAVASALNLHPVQAIAASMFFFPKK